ncbi:hypothetical protein [Gordonia shandongensis]|nr:hypothetical protein [Gordonia shandongensis]
MSSTRRRKPSRTTFARAVGVWRRSPRALAEQRERLVTARELDRLRLAG